MKMKKVIDFDPSEVPNLTALCEFILQIIDPGSDPISNPTTLSYDGVMKKIEEGTLHISEMKENMKITQSRFFHYHDKDGTETIVQISVDKLAVFSEEKITQELKECKES